MDKTIQVGKYTVIVPDWWETPKGLYLNVSSKAGRRTQYVRLRTTNVQPVKTVGTLHQYILYGPPKSGQEIDHIDGNGLNNAPNNLRWVTHTQNEWNKTKLGKNNSSGHKGARKIKNGRWKAEIEANKQRYFLGYYDTPEEASAAYIRAVNQRKANLPIIRSDRRTRRKIVVERNLE